jgi:hypothetical protein
VLALHNVHLQQVRSAFASMAYYPALLGACGLGERILNHLVLTLRDDYAEHDATRHVAGRESLNDWSKCVKTLKRWGVFSEDVGRDYERLRKQRIAAVHYRPALDEDDARIAALNAVRLLCSLVERIFNAVGQGAHYFTAPIGRPYVRSEAEDDPFVKRFILPACALVSPRFRFIPSTSAVGGFDVYDDPEIGVGEPPLSDEEFADPTRARPQVPYPF